MLPSFEWDPKKSETNIGKHGVSFEEACSAFYDVQALVIPDPDHSIDEDRFLLLGMSGRARLLVVVHCFRGPNDSIRIISARKAAKSEDRQYWRAYDA